MFEKEAEEEINKEHWTYSIFKDLAQEYWQKGAEFGYNKANDEKEQEIEELRKEIRLLKTDISIMQIGFENE